MNNTAFQAWLAQGQRLLARWCRCFAEWLEGAPRSATSPWGSLAPAALPGTAAATLERLERIVLTEAVLHTLFDQYQSHCQTDRGEEETGWVLLGLREETLAVAMAALPAGAGREAGVAHIRFDVDAQALASRILRQADRRLTILGVVHTHPGSLRHPSRGDYEGDRQWVRLLRGGEGIFGIGTADAEAWENKDTESHGWSTPKPHMHVCGRFRWSWYALGEQDRNYRPMPVEVIPGEDLAQPLQLVWPIIERHAAQLEALCQLLARIRFSIQSEPPALWLTFPAPYQAQLGVKLNEHGVSYWQAPLANGQALPPGDAAWRAAPCQASSLAEGVFQLLAAEAAQTSTVTL